MKTCSICKIPKEDIQYHKKSRSVDGLAPNCKECESKRKKTSEAIIQRRERYKNNSAHIIAVNKAYRKKNWNKSQKTLHDYYTKNKTRWLEAGWKQKGILNSEGRFFTQEDFAIMLQSQGGVCKICESKGETHGKGLCVDHNHDTGVARGILCGFCNTAIAYLKEDAELVLKALNYLKCT